MAACLGIPLGARDSPPSAVAIRGLALSGKGGGDVGVPVQGPRKQAKLVEVWAQPSGPKGQTLLTHFFCSGQLGACARAGGERPPGHLVGAVKRPKR